MITLSRREFVHLLELLAGRTLLNDAAPILCLFVQINQSDGNSASSLPPNSQNILASTPGSQAGGTTPGAFEALLGGISDYVRATTQQINNAANTIANQTYTLAVSNGVSVQGAGSGFSASVGTALSFNFSTLDYQTTNFVTTAPEVAGSVLPGGSVGPSISIGAGEISSFLGTSTSISGSFLNFTFNEGYAGIGLTLPLGTSSASASEQSETKPIGNVQSGNLNSDAQSIENTLWNMSQDPISGSDNYR